MMIFQSAFTYEAHTLSFSFESEALDDNALVFLLFYNSNYDIRLPYAVEE